MALGETYVTLVQLKEYVGIDDDTDDSKLTMALASTSSGIESVCNRQFNDAGVASSRIYYPDSRCLTEVDDFHTTAGLIVETDDGGTGTYGTTWAATDYQLEPLNGIVNGQPGWPWWEIWAVESRYFPTCSRRAPVQVTAQWGWAAVPDPVQQACLIVAEETFKLKDAPFGVAGFGEFGQIRVRSNPMAMEKLDPYIRDKVLVA